MWVKSNGHRRKKERRRDKSKVSVNNGQYIPPEPKLCLLLFNQEMIVSEVCPKTLKYIEAYLKNILTNYVTSIMNHRKKLQKNKIRKV